MLATTTPDQTVPATSSSVHYKLGCRGAAFDLNAACAGFVYGLVTAVALLDAGYERALVVGSDTLSQITDQKDRSTAVIFADGAGAIVVEATEGEPLILARRSRAGWVLDSDPLLRQGRLHHDGRSRGLP